MIGPLATRIAPRPIGEWIRDFDDAVAAGRGATDAASRAEAIAKLKALGLTDGEAERWITRRR